MADKVCGDRNIEVWVELEREAKQLSEEKRVGPCKGI